MGLAAYVHPRGLETDVTNLKRSQRAQECLFRSFLNFHCTAMCFKVTSAPLTCKAWLAQVPIGLTDSMELSCLFLTRNGTQRVVTARALCAVGVFERTAWDAWPGVVSWVVGQWHCMISILLATHQCCRTCWGLRVVSIPCRSPQHWTLIRLL